MPVSPRPKSELVAEVDAYSRLSAAAEYEVERALSGRAMGIPFPLRGPFLCTKKPSLTVSTGVFYDQVAEKNNFVYYNINISLFNV